MCIICPILRTQKFASILLTVLSSACIGLSIWMYLCIEIEPGYDWLNGFKYYYEYYAFGLWGSLFGLIAGLFGLCSWNDMEQRSHVSCTLRIHGWSAAISVLAATAFGAWSSWCCYQFWEVFVNTDIKCGEISCETIHWLWIWENILLTAIMIFSATSAFRMMNYGCGCKFCFFPCMCCCEIPLGRNPTVEPMETNNIQVQPAPYNQSYYSNAPPPYQSYPYGSYRSRYSSSSGSSSSSGDSYVIRNGNGEIVSYFPK